VDIVVETAGTLSQSLSALAFGGFAAIISFTGGPLANLDIRQVIGSIVRMKGIGTGPRTSLEAMNRVVVQHEITPVVEQVFPLAKVAKAFAVMERGGYFGKVGVTIGG